VREGESGQHARERRGEERMSGERIRARSHQLYDGKNGSRVQMFTILLCYWHKLHNIRAMSLEVFDVKVERDPHANPIVCSSRI
jgi:hypothetical protein